MKEQTTKEQFKKSSFLKTFGVCVLSLALVRCVFPSIATVDDTSLTSPSLSSSSIASTSPSPSQSPHVSSYVEDNGKHHPIISVPSYDQCFPDSNHVQLTAARRWGVSPVRDRSEAEARKADLVYVGCSPYFYVEELHSSIPYLVPRAAILLQDIGQAFYDSLQVKGIPLHQLVVTSVMRTHADVNNLRRSNGNATENSCHLYGTTFDISYISYKPVYTPGEPRRRQVRDDSLKYVLSEVLHDMRKNGRCYIKYERRQSCFHMTTR